MFKTWIIYFILPTLFSLLLFYYLYKWSTSTFHIFIQKNVPHNKPIPLFGNSAPLFFRKKTMHESMIDLYTQFRDKRYYGFYQFKNPLLAIRDPILIKQIGVKDFDSFIDHRDLLLDEKIEPLLGKSLFMLKGQRWRNMRSTLSPAFTGLKMKQMFQLVVDCAQETTDLLTNEILTSLKNNQPYVSELKDLFTRCTTDVIASTAFGIQINSLKTKENIFYMMGQRSTNFKIKDLLKVAFMKFFPKLTALISLKLFDSEQSEFYHSLVHDTIKYRQKEGIIRPDMIHLLMQARQGALNHENTNENSIETTDGYATATDISNEQLKAERKRNWTDDDVTAQCFLFFIAGFETSATLMCVIGHELAENPDIQAKLIAEIDKTSSELNGQELTYDAMQKMKYLDMVISESLRKWPPGIATDRVCVKPYEFIDADGKQVKFNIGDGVYFPIFGIHRDPEYYPNPDLFDPERFSIENKENIIPFTYLPFGVGPRNCIGSRFALMEAKIFLYYMLSRFTFEITETTQIPLRLVQVGFRITAEKGFNINLKLRQ